MIAAYLRVSTDRQDEDLQRRTILNYLQHDNVKWYIDHGLTGTNTYRPEYQRMIKDMSTGDTLICYEWSRLWRNLHDQTIGIALIFDKGIKAYSATEGKLEDFEDELIVNIKGAINQHEHKRMLRRSKDGIEAKQRQVAEAMHKAMMEGKKYSDIPESQRWRNRFGTT
jgi:DNA invertase Pin-like site-specific DNA recombinase